MVTAAVSMRMKIQIINVQRWKSYNEIYTYKFNKAVQAMVKKGYMQL